MDGFFDPEKLQRLALEGREAYAAADPFPHAAFEGLLPPAVLEKVLAEYPGPDEAAWTRFDHVRGRKLALNDEAQMGLVTRGLFRALNSSAFIGFLEALTGIEGLIPDPHLTGGGLHQIERGGYLKIHADFNWHERLKLDRRLNLLIYLNKDWPEEYGGHLQLWDAGMKRCVRSYLPVFNRCVLFNTTDAALHGHPDPLTCPDGRARRSLALYYYSNGRPAAERSRHRSTLYRNRPGGREKVYTTRESLEKLVPPVVFDLWRGLKTVLRRKGAG